MSLLVLLVAALAIAAGAARAAPRHDQSATALPDRDSFLAEARKHLASNALLQSRFTYRERGTDVRLNPFGALGTGPLETFQVYPLPDGMTYRRLVERNDVPLTRAELAAQDRQFLARYRKWQRDLARDRESEREAAREPREAARKKDRAQADEAVSLFEFALERRETYEGQPAIVVSFKAKPTARPRTREGRVASSFTGHAWIHEHEHEVLRVEADAATDTAFGFGIIARLYKGARGVFTRRKIGDVWLPVETRVQGTARALLFRKTAFVYAREYSGYRPFDPSELMSFLDASRERN